MPLLASLDGRSNDSVTTPDGRVIHGQSLIGLLMEIDGIERFRIIQKRPDAFHVQLVKNDRFPVGAEARIRRDWAERLRASLHVTFEYLSQLPAEGSGKFRHIVSELAERNENQLAAAGLKEKSS